MKITLISPCYFCLWMAASYIKILKSSVDFTNVFQKNLWKPVNGCFYFMTTSNVYVTYMKLVMYFPVGGKLKLSHFPKIWWNHHIKSRIVPTFENCKIFPTYYFSYARDYKAPLRGGNYSSNIRTLASEISENVFLFAFILFVSYVTLFSRTVILIWFKLQIENIYWTYSKEGQKLIKGICYRKAF